MQSLGGIIVVIVALPERSTAPYRLPVDTSAATCTVVNEQTGEAFQQIVPETIQVFNVAYFGKALTLRLIGSLPIGFGLDVTILPVIVDAVILNHITIVLAEPLAGIGTG